MKKQVFGLEYLRGKKHIRQLYTTTKENDSGKASFKRQGKKRKKVFRKTQEEFLELTS